MTTEEQLAALRSFAQAVMDGWPDGADLDGGDLQTLAVKYGLLKAENVTEACGEYCRCAEYDDFPITCYRRTALLTGKAEQGRQQFGEVT